MNGRVLVTYGSRVGGTAQIAGAVAKYSAPEASVVTMLPAHEVHSVAPYDGVVLGSAISSGPPRPPGACFRA